MLFRSFRVCLVIYFAMKLAVISILFCSLAASLLPSGAAAVGFGGYVGSSRVDSSFSAEAPTASLVGDWLSIAIFKLPCICRYGYMYNVKKRNKKIVFWFPPFNREVPWLMVDVECGLRK